MIKTIMTMDQNAGKSRSKKNTQNEYNKDKNIEIDMQ